MGDALSVPFIVSWAQVTRCETSGTGSTPPEANTRVWLGMAALLIYSLHRLQVPLNGKTKAK